MSNHDPSWLAATYNHFDPGECLAQKSCFIQGQHALDTSPVPFLPDEQNPIQAVTDKRSPIVTCHDQVLMSDADTGQYRAFPEEGLAELLSAWSLVLEYLSDA